MSAIISEAELKQALLRGEMAASVELSIEEYRDLVYQSLYAITLAAEFKKATGYTPSEYQAMIEEVKRT